MLTDLHVILQLLSVQVHPLVLTLTAGPALVVAVAIVVEHHWNAVVVAAEEAAI